MKFNALRAACHNLADSLASGLCLVIGLYEIDIFSEARCADLPFIEVDFLAGRCVGEVGSPSLKRAVQLFSEALPSFFDKHGIAMSDVRRFKVQYVPLSPLGKFIVIIENGQGRSATDVYYGSPGKRRKVLDPQGRIRTKRAVLNLGDSNINNGYE